MTELQKENLASVERAVDLIADLKHGRRLRLIWESPDGYCNAQISGGEEGFYHKSEYEQPFDPCAPARFTNHGLTEKTLLSFLLATRFEVASAS